MEFLGLVISQDWVEMDPVKVARVCDWLVSQNYTNLQAFLDFTNFYQWFIHGFLDIAWPLFNLTGSSSIWT